MHPEIVNALLPIAERDETARKHLADLRQEHPEATDAETASILLQAAREGVAMSEGTAKEILAVHASESDRLRRAELAEDRGERPAEREPSSRPFEATISETPGVFDPVGTLDRFREEATDTDSQSFDLAEHARRIDRERAEGRRVVRVNRGG